MNDEGTKPRFCALPLERRVRRVAAWMHDQPERYDVIHEEAKALWLKAWPKQVEHYTIPLYRHAEREPMSTEAACSLVRRTIGTDPMLDGNYLKLLRAVELAHGIEPNVELTSPPITAGTTEK